jgi:hypothetical protein
MKKSDGSNKTLQSRLASGSLLYCFHSLSTMACALSNSPWRIWSVCLDMDSVEFMAG